MRDWQGQRVVVIGAARQGTALARYLVDQGARVVVNDQRPAEQLQAAREALEGLPVEWILGGHPLYLAEQADLICPSGGVPLDLPLIQEALRRGVPLANDAQIFLEIVPCPVIGITGSAGKTTTTTLVGRMADATISRMEGMTGYKPRRAWVGGNIGNPLISLVEEMQPEDLVVMELSSFQLEIMTCSTDVAAILNITPNHLDRHGTMEAYVAAKRRLLDFQKPRKEGHPHATVLGRDDPGAWSLAPIARTPVWTFSRELDRDGNYPGAFIRGQWLYVWNGQQEKAVMPCSAIRLRGEHNLLNVLAACAISAAANLEPEAMLEGIQDFGGVPHRLEYVRTWGGAAWYNDSIATAPERSMAAIHSFSEPIVLLAGGRDKDLPWGDFASLAHQRVDHLILFGEAAGKIRQAVGTLRPGSRPFTLDCCNSLKEAVQAAARRVEPGDVVLLSPGGTSFDEFRDFEDRGEAFRKWVHELS